MIKMFEIIDLSQEIFTGMPVFPGLPEVKITMHASHEQWDGIPDSDVVSPAVNRLEMGEHTGTHVDAINHMARSVPGTVDRHDAANDVLYRGYLFGPVA